MDVKYVRSVIALLAIVLIFAGTAAAQSSNIFVLDITVSGDDIQLNKVSFTNGTLNTYDEEGGNYRLQLVDSEGQPIYTTEFAGKQTEYRYGAAPEETESRRMYFRLPYYAEAETVQIYRNDNRIYQIDLPQRLCKADNMCSTYCAQSQHSDPDCSADQDNILLIVFAGIILIVIAGAAALFYTNREEQPENVDPSDLGI